MQYLYIRRRFFGRGFQLGLSGGILLSSAGLAIALLLYTAAASSAASGLPWRATSSLAPTPLVTSPEFSTTVPLASLAGEPRHYWVATTGAYRGPVAASPASDLSEQEASFDQPYPAPSNPVKATIQRSWTIIKLAFR